MTLCVCENDDRFELVKENIDLKIERENASSYLIDIENVARVSEQISGVNRRM